MDEKYLFLLFVIFSSTSYAQKTIRLGIAAGFGPSEYAFKGGNLDKSQDVRAKNTGFNGVFSVPVALTIDFVPDNNRFITGFDLGYQSIEKTTGSSRTSTSVNYLEAQYSFIHIGPSTKWNFNPRKKFNVYLKAAPYLSFMVNSLNTFESIDTETQQKTTGVFADPRKIMLSGEAGLGFTYSIVYLELKGLFNFVKAPKGPTCDINTAYASLGFRFAKFNDD